MLLQELLKVCNPQELGELYAFWNGEGTAGEVQKDLPESLQRRMTDEVLVRRRVRFLSRKLVDLLRFFLGRRQFEANLDAVRRSRSFSFTSPHEVEAAVRALVQRGFLFPRRRTTARPNRYVVPNELGEVLRGELEDLDLDLTEAFSLRRMLTTMSQLERCPQGDGQGSQAPEGEGNGEDHPSPKERTRELSALVAVEQRRDDLEEEVREVFDRAIEQGGGLLPRSTFKNQDPGSPPFARRKVKDALERACLGTVRHLALGEYGINHFDDVVIVFEEVLHAQLQSHDPRTRHPSARDRSLGVDLLSDLSHLLVRLSRDKVRLTQSGMVYRTAARKIEEQLILTSKGNFDSECLFRFLLELALTRHLARRTGDRYLALTSKGRTWPRLSVAFKLKELLAAVRDEDGQAFHRPRLKTLCLEILKGLEIDRWYEFGLVVGLIRHRYLATLEEHGVRDDYQSRFQYSSQAHMRDLPQLTQIVSSFLAYELHILGLVDLMLEGDRPVGLKLSSLAAKALGLGRAEDNVAAPTRLLVNPDFEILVFQEGDAFEVIQRLDRFAERVAHDDSHRFRITARSVERAVAAGMTAAEILETLSENSSSELPQNVVYSIRDYADKVRFVKVQRALLVSARHKEVIDHLLRRSDVRKIVIERLSPRILSLKADAEVDELLALLEEDGVFLEGESLTHDEQPGPDAEASTPGPEAESAGPAGGDG